MFDVLFSIGAFVVALGLLIIVHEFGHFWVARKLGVKVLRFSVGFGKPIWTKVAGPEKIEYSLSAIPLGGYVKMLDEREGEVPEEELPRAFNRQPVSKRFAIVVAGPAFNFLFAILAYAVIFMAGVQGIKPVIGEVAPASIAAEAGLRPGDEIVRVNGVETPTWERARMELMQEAVDEPEIRLEVMGRDQMLREVLLNTSQLNFLQDEKTDLIEQLGIRPWRPQIPPTIAEVLPDGAAAAAGFMAGDRVVAMDGEPVTDVRQWVDYVRAHPGQPIRVTVERDGQRMDLTVTPGTRSDDSGESYGFIGVQNVVEIPDEIRQQMLVTQRFGPVEALSEAVRKTWNMSVLTLKVLGKLVVGEASLKNLSGPITIAKYAGMSAQIGIEPFFAFLAVISISLGVLNLLPIPMLDGGHLFYYLIEIVKGSPVSEQFEEMGQRIGLALLLMLMSVAFYNDILRLLE